MAQARGTKRGTGFRKALKLRMARMTVRARIMLLALTLVLPVSVALSLFLDASLLQLRATSHARIRMVAEVVSQAIRNELTDARTALRTAVPQVDAGTLPRLAAMVPGDVAVIVLDAQQKVVLRSALAEAQGDSFARQPADVMSASIAGPAIGKGHDGVDLLFSTVPMAETGWQVRAATSLAAINAEADRLRRTSTLVVLTLVLLTLALAWRCSADIVAPIARLREAAVMVAAGHDHERVPPMGPPEIAALAHQFNRMVEVRATAESRLQGILDTAVDAILTVDESQTIVQANPAAALLFGTTVPQLLGTSLDALIPHRSRADHRQQVNRFGRERASPRHMGHQREVPALRADGTLIPVEVSISHLEVAGRLTYTAILRDVTERVKAAQALADSEAMLRRLLMHLPDAVFVNSAGRLTFVNAAAQALFGASEAELLDRSPLDFIHPDSLAKAVERMDALQHGTLQVAPLAGIRIRRRDGSEREVESLETSIRHDGQLSILVVMRDVSDLRIAERQLQRSESDLRRLVGAMAEVQEQERLRISRDLHDDLQQTLAAIRMDAALLADAVRDAPALAADAARIDALAAAAIVSTRRLIGGLRPQALDTLGIDAALRALAGSFESRTQIRCHYVCAAAEQAGQIDPRLATCLYRVAQEALNNVMKHSGAAHATVRLRPCPAGWKLSIHDDGKGLQPRDLGKSQSFGLIGMHERVRAAGGWIRVLGKPGRGTMVTAILPAH